MWKIQRILLQFQMNFFLDWHVTKHMQMFVFLHKRNRNIIFNT